MKMFLMTRKGQWAMLPVLLLLSACGFYLRGMQSSMPTTLKQLTIENASVNLSHTLNSFARNLSGLSINLRSLANGAMAPLPSEAPTPSVGLLMSKKDRAVLQIIEEQWLENSAITDATTKNQLIRIVYRLRYRLLGEDGRVWLGDSLLERESTVSFFESERLSSENKLQSARDQLYWEMTRTLLNQAMIARPPD